MWREYFPNATIVGMDINPPIEVEGCTVVQGDQGNCWDLSRLCQDGLFDVIIDDGSHRHQHQITSFYTLFPSGMNPGGLYIIEDLHIRPDPWKTLLYFLHQFGKDLHKGTADIRMDPLGRLLFITRE